MNEERTEYTAPVLTVHGEFVTLTQENNLNPINDLPVGEIGDGLT